MVSWTRQQVFRLVHNNNLVYNQCWEDPRLDQRALRIGPGDNVLVLTSAGCNALDYLLHSPDRVDAVDMNPRQNALLELKIAGIRGLAFNDFFSFFGRGYHLNAEALYRSSMRPFLPEFARNYWDKHISFFSPRGLRSSFYFYGTAGVVAQFMRHYFSLKGMREAIHRIFNVNSLAEQRAIYFNEMKPKFWNGFMRWFSRRGTTMSFLGVPRSQFIQIEKFYDGGMAKFIEDCLDAVFCYLPLKDNYFYRLYLFGQYSKECCPAYLKEANFKKLYPLVDRVKTHNSTVSQFLTNDTYKIHKVSLLDHMDWLYQKHADEVRAEWQGLVARSAEKSKVIWRSASLKVDFVDPLPVNIKGQAYKVGDLLHYETELAQRLHKVDRVHTYGSFYIANMQVH